MSAIVTIDRATKTFGGFRAVDDVSIEIEEGEFFALLGPSGCGKTTLLRMVSGFETPTEGRVLIGGEDMTETPPNRRPVNMVFQSYAVFPHMTVARNVGYGLRIEGVARAEIASRVKEALAQVQLTEFANRKPDQLSGGQRQRVALARALVKRPRVLLLDEPLSALDAKLRDQMRLELVKLQKVTGVSFIMVTHDQDEAMAVADRIAVLDRGRLRQIADPATLYNRPADAFVADFIGRANFFDVTGTRLSEDGVIVSAELLGDLSFAEAPGDDLALAVRPEKIRIGAAEPGEIVVNATLGDVAFQGDRSIVEALTESGRALTVSVGGETAARLAEKEEGAPIKLVWDRADMMLLRR